MTCWIFGVGGLRFAVTETAKPGHFVVVCNNGHNEGGFESAPGVSGARAVLFRALDVFGRKGWVTREEANWPEKDIPLLASAAVPVG